jgi:hypothetical protein
MLVDGVTVLVNGYRRWPYATARGQFQITTDGFGPYRSAIRATLHDRCDFAMLIKVYRSSQEGEARYSPAEVASTEVVPVMGQPDPERICTAIVERNNLSTRMSNRRFTRLTNAFSKKWENHWASVACWFAFYNFCRVHKSLRVTPAMAAGIADHIWSVRELLEAAVNYMTAWSNIKAMPNHQRITLRMSKDPNTIGGMYFTTKSVSEPGMVLTRGFPLWPRPPSN